jgi:hypothetical protein
MTDDYGLAHHHVKTKIYRTVTVLDKVGKQALPR